MYGSSVSSSNTPTSVRRAKPVDGAAIARIYNQGIEDRVATFQTVPRTISDVEQLLGERADRYPTVVAERAGEVVAWASAGIYHSRLVSADC